jgi:hypothetical protein
MATTRGNSGPASTPIRSMTRRDLTDRATRPGRIGDAARAELSRRGLPVPAVVAQSRALTPEIVRGLPRPELDRLAARATSRNDRFTLAREYLRKGFPMPAGWEGMPARVRLADQREEANHRARLRAADYQQQRAKVDARFNRGAPGQLPQIGGSTVQFARPTAPTAAAPAAARTSNS